MITAICMFLHRFVITVWLLILHILDDQMYQMASYSNCYLLTNGIKRWLLHVFQHGLHIDKLNGWFHIVVTDTNSNSSSTTSSDYADITSTTSSANDNVLETTTHECELLKTASPIVIYTIAKSGIYKQFQLYYVNRCQALLWYCV